MMQARLKEDYRFKTGVAFAGRIYVKEEWRDVPDHGLDEAARRMSDDKEVQLEFRQTAAEKRAEREARAEGTAAHKPAPAVKKGPVAKTPTPTPVKHPDNTPSPLSSRPVSGEATIKSPAPTIPPADDRKG